MKEGLPRLLHDKPRPPPDTNPEHQNESAAHEIAVQHESVLLVPQGIDRRATGCRPTPEHESGAIP